MSRTLGFYPLFWAGITIVVIISTCLFNMHLLVRYKRNPFTYCIHVLSLFSVLSLLFQMISSAVFVHPLSLLYHRLAQFCLLLAGLSIVAGVIYALISRDKLSFRNLPHTIADALESIEDIVFVIDRDGSIMHINHPEKYSTLLGNISTMKQLYCFAMDHSILPKESVKTLGNLSDPVSYELYFQPFNMHCILRISPIIIGNTRKGYTAVLEDVSDIRSSEYNLQQQNESLKLANGKLSNYIKAAGALEAEKERLQILEQVQKTIIHDMEKALSYTRTLKQSYSQIGTHENALKELAGQLRQIYQKVRHAVGEIAGKDVQP